MSIKFAEEMLDGMVGDDGTCGERGLSAKQYDVLKPYLEETDREECGGWQGDYGVRRFYAWDAEGYVGRYKVKLNLFKHFNLRASVERIERWIDEVPTFEGSEWAYEPKQRADMELTLIRHYVYERPAYSYGYETAHIYTLADADGNCYVWKTTKWMEEEFEDENGFIESTLADPGDKVELRATVKEHGEWKGIKQTVLTRVDTKRVIKR